MAAGLIAVAAVTAVSAAVQYYNAQKARGASRRELDRIEEIYNGLVPPDYDLSIEDPPELHDQKLKSPEFSPEMAAPKWNLSKLDPKDLEMVQKFSPQIAPLIEEAAPQLVEKSAEMKEGSQAQKDALRKFMAIGEGGFDPEHAQRVQDAKDRAQAEAQSRGASIMQDFERRGLGGSGLELAAKMGASSQAMDRNARMGLAAEADAYKNQLAALAQGAQLGGDIYAQDERFQSRNNQIINDFNKRMSARHQNWEQMRANAINAADLRNIQEAQRISDENIRSGNEADIRHQRRMDDITRYNMDHMRGERDRQDQLASDKYIRDQQQRAYMDAREILRKKWAQDNVRYQNTLKDRKFANDQTIASGRAGMADRNISHIMGSAADRNAAIQGFTNAAVSGIGSYGNRNFQRQQGEYDRLAYGKPGYQERRKRYDDNGGMY